MENGMTPFSSNAGTRLSAEADIAGESCSGFPGIILLRKQPPVHKGDGVPGQGADPSDCGNAVQLLECPDCLFGLGAEIAGDFGERDLRQIAGAIGQLALAILHILVFQPLAEQIARIDRWFQIA